MSLQTRLITPLDVLMLRGNKSFGDSGEHGASQMPPSPSVLSGALRSFWLAEQKENVRNFKEAHPESLKEPLRSQLGTPSCPGSFRLTAAGLVRKKDDGSLERLFAIPSDLVLQKHQKEDSEPVVYALQPQALPEGLLTGSVDRQTAILKAPPGKPEGGYWLKEEGFVHYLNGQKPRAAHLVKASELWKSDWRLGIALDAQRRTASEGQLYTNEAIVLKDNVCLFAEISGAVDFPAQGVLRLGGDGRAAAFETARFNGLPALTPQQGRIKLLLTSPAIFPDGSRLPGEKLGRIAFSGGSARVVAASVPRHQVISGWDLARWQPKPAERVVPAGSVYWLDEVQFSGTSLQTALQDLLLCDLDVQRRAEGYNACLLAAWMS